MSGQRPSSSGGGGDGFPRDMNIMCSRCSQWFVATDVAIATRCEHVFHWNCIRLCLERSNSCPHCRAKLIVKDLCRIYFTIGLHNDPEVAYTLQDNIDRLEYKMMLKNAELDKCRKEIATFNKKTTRLVNEIQRLKNVMKFEATKHKTLKRLIKDLKSKTHLLQPLRKECEGLQEKIQFLQKSLEGFNIETVTKGLCDYKNPSAAIKALRAFTSILKKGMKTIAIESKEPSIKLREEQSKIYSLTGQIRSLENKIKDQDEQNHHLLMKIKRAAGETSSLKQELDGLQQALLSPTDNQPSAVALKRVRAESTPPHYLKRAYLEGTLEENR
ncbi:Uncharacterized protein GBIM_20859 [Gryllus bimaculatus]|nr:Uncharacterized protein GBIM_20859 [Gryllus bimaculatus]